MNATKVIEAVCPYCGKKNAVIKEGFDNQTEVYRCDTEIGGCDLDFVVRLSVHINTFTARIEGEIDKLDAEAQS